MGPVDATACLDVVADLVFRIAALISRYMQAIGRSNSDVETLCQQIKDLQAILKHGKVVLEDPSNKSLATSQAVAGQLEDCKRDLASLYARIQPLPADRIPRRYRGRGLIWPIGNDATEDLIDNVETHQSRLLAVLEIDETDILLHIGGEPRHQPEDWRSIGPHFLVPFARNKDYVARPMIERDVARTYASPATRIGLVGTGGSGKSQIAIEFAYKAREKSPGINVFWVLGGSRASFVQSYDRIAQAVGIPRRQDPGTDTLALVRDHLQIPNAKPWLMIIDNADDHDIFFDEAPSRPLSKFIPRTGPGRVLITSRNMKVAGKLVGTAHSAVTSLTAMEPIEAVDLLRKKLRPTLAKDMDEETVADFVKALEFVPLAVTQAAAFINRRTPRITVGGYLDQFLKSERSKGSLLNSDNGALRKDETIPNPVVVTWQMTFEQVRKEKQNAANLLFLLCFFSWKDIPAAALEGHHEEAMQTAGRSNGKAVVEDAPGAAETHEYFELHEDWDILRDYLLVSGLSETNCFDMHPLVQFCTKKWLLRCGDTDRWKSLFVRCIAAKFPDGNFESWLVCQTYVPHILPFIQTEPCRLEDFKSWNTILSGALHYLYLNGRYPEAMSVANKLFAMRKTVLGMDHLGTLKTKKYLATILRQLDRLEESRKMYMEVLAAESASGRREDAAESIATMRDLALLSSLTGRPDEAEVLELEISGINITRFGQAHPETMEGMVNLSMAFRDQGKLSEAESLQKTVLESLRATLGPGDPRTLVAGTSLGLTYLDQGRLKEAKKLQSESARARASITGDQHPDTMLCFTRLATVLCRQGEYKAADKLLSRVLDSYRAGHGEDHAGTIMAMSNLAAVRRKLDKTDEAASLELQAVQRAKNTLGLNHTISLNLMANDAWQLCQGGLWEEAERLGVIVMGMRKDKLGVHHPDTLMSMYNVARIRKEMGAVKDAIKLMEECIALQQLELGLGHPQVKRSLQYLKDWKAEKH